MKNKLVASTLALSTLLISSVTLADPTGGSRSDSDLLRPGQNVTYTLLLEPNEKTRFNVQGDGDGDIDCYLYDGNANLVASDTDSTDTCLIDIVPRWRGVFTLNVVNNGRIASYYNFRVW